MSKDTIKKAWKAYGLDKIDWKQIGQQLQELETMAEVDYTTTIDSVKAYLNAKGLILPKNFKTFWSWYVIHYGHIVDEYGFDEITQEQITEYSREVTAKIDILPHKAESINIDEILTDIFPDISPEDLNALNTNLLRNGALKLWHLYYTGTKKKLWVNLGYLRAAGINRQSIADVFGQIHHKKTPYGASKQLNSDEIYNKIVKTGIKR